MLTNCSNRARHPLRGELQGLHSHHAAAPRQPGKPDLQPTRYIMLNANHFTRPSGPPPRPSLRVSLPLHLPRASPSPRTPPTHLPAPMTSLRSRCIHSLNPPNRTCYDGSGAACAGDCGHTRAQRSHGRAISLFFLAPFELLAERGGLRPD
jgi:hypothetical protein